MNLLHHPPDKKFFRSVILFILCWTGTTSFTPPPDQEWQLKRESDNIKVFYRIPPDSKIHEIKTVGQVNRSLPELLSVIRNVPGFPDWVYSCKSAKLLQKPSDTESIYYSEMSFPWPMQNRDFIARSSLQDRPAEKQIIINVQGTPDYLPEYPNLVRIKTLKVTWVLTEIEAGKAQVEYLLKTDPGGNIPAWMINMAIDKGPFQSIQQLIEMVGK